MTLLLRHVLLAALMVVSVSPARAAQGGEALAIVTGPKTGTYIAIGKNIAEAARKEGESLEVKASNGSIDNIRRITEAGENAGLGIVQSDVLGFLRRSQNPRSQQIATHLRLVAPLYAEEVHVLANKNIKDFQDLTGRRVVVGQQGSGNMLTAMNLFTITGVRPAKTLQAPPDQGVVAVLGGDADAVIFTAGKPVTLFRNLASVRSDLDGKYADLLRQVHFIPLTGEAVAKEYAHAEITPQDYDFVDQTVPTVAVTSVLVAYDFSSLKNTYYRMRCTQLETIGRAMRTHMEELREQGHPKWKEVDLSRDVAPWRRDACAWRNAEREQTPAAAMDSELERDLLSIIQKGHASPDASR